MKTYRIVRMFEDERIPRQHPRGLRHMSLEEVQEHCRNPETSSKTATSERAQTRTRRYGPWFEGSEVDHE